MGVGRARAKLLLFGEHVAVYGAPAVGLSLPWPLQVESTPAPSWALPGLGPHEPAVRALVAGLEALAQEEGLPVPAPALLRFTTEVPLSSGFGSSGALCGALVNLFWPDLPLEARDRLAWRAEHLFHGTPSGIDTALALREGWWVLDAAVKPAAARPLAPPDLALVVGGLVREGDTKSLVAGLSRRRAEGEPGVLGALDRLAELSRQAIAGLEAGGSGALPALVAEARDRLRSLGLETPGMTAVLDGAVARGALAGKLSGAGGGGAFVVLYPDRRSAEAALPALGGLVSAPAWTCRPRLVSSPPAPAKSQIHC